MDFTKDRDEILGPGGNCERMVRPYQQIIETQKSIMGGFEAPLTRTMRDIQDATAALRGQPSIVQAAADMVKHASGIHQMIADQSTSLDVAKSIGMSNLTADIARSMSTGKAFEGLTQRIAEQTQQPFHGLAARIIEQQQKPFHGLTERLMEQLHPLQSLGASVAAARLPQEVMRDAWRPVLMRGFEAPTFSVISQIASAVEAYNGSLAKTVLRGMAPAMDAARESQTRQAQDIIRAINMAAGPSKALQKWSAIDNSYRLQGVWSAPVIPQWRTPAHRPPTAKPEPFTAFPPADAPPGEASAVEAPLDKVPPAAEQHAELAPEPEDDPLQLTGRWEVLRPLQPVENALQGILHGPLIVKIVAIGVGQIVVAVIGGGCVYFLFYCC